MEVAHKDSVWGKVKHWWKFDLSKTTRQFVINTLLITSVALLAPLLILSFARYVKFLIVNVFGG